MFSQRVEALSKGQHWDGRKPGGEILESDGCFGSEEGTPGRGRAEREGLERGIRKIRSGLSCLRPLFAELGMSLADFRAENLGYLAQSQEIAGAVSGLNFGEQSGIVITGNVPQRSEDNGYKI